jgi:hypothetical protein
MPASPYISLRPLQNGTLCPISASGSNFGTLVKLQRYPRNILYIPVVEIFAFLELEHKLPFFKGLNSLIVNFVFFGTKHFRHQDTRMNFNKQIFFVPGGIFPA